VALLHLHIIAPLIILPLYRFPKYGLIINILAIIFGLFLNVSPKLLFNIDPIHQITHTFQKSMSYYYLHTEQYLTSYAIGVLFAYLCLKHRNIYLGGKLIETISWIIFPMISVSVIYWNEYLYELVLNNQDNQLSALLYTSVGKVLFVSGFVWIIFATYSNRVGMKGFIFLYVYSYSYSIKQDLNRYYFYFYF
jgi:hypothetical protein